MRPLETLILALLGLSLITLGLPRPRWLAVLPSAAAVLLTPIHLAIEGYRWQMIPAYGAALVLTALCLRPQPARAPWPVWARALSALGGGLLACLLAALPVLFPLPRFATPGGPYAVGTRAFHLIDTAREEIYASPPGGPRELMIQVWYPAAPAPGAQTGPWMDRADVMARAITAYLELPPFLLDHLPLARTHSYPGAPLAALSGHLPVVIYSHGWNGFRAVSTVQVEALASHGYFVIAIEHTYGAMVTVFDDGRLIYNNPATLPDEAVVGPAAYRQAIETLEATYAADIRFVMDQLETDLLGVDFAGKLDLARLGVWGHSTGGGAAVIACTQDPRCRAGLAMDAWVIPVPEVVRQQGLPRPFLFMNSERWSSAENTSVLQELYGLMQGDGYRMTVAGTGHYDFTDLPLLSPLAPYMGLKGPIPAAREIEIINAYLLGFFDTYLKEEASPLLQAGPAPYPEVQFEIIRPGP